MVLKSSELNVKLPGICISIGIRKFEQNTTDFIYYFQGHFHFEVVVLFGFIRNFKAILFLYSKLLHQERG